MSNGNQNPNENKGQNNQGKGNQHPQKQQQPQQNNGGGNEGGKEALKVKTEFNQNIEKLAAILGGTDKLTLNRKISGSAVSDVVADLFKEEAKATESEVKVGLKNLIVKNAQLDKELAIERKKLDDYEVAKKKEFNGEARALFGKIDGIGSIVSTYAASLVALSADESTDSLADEDGKDLSK